MIRRPLVRTVLFSFFLFCLLATGVSAHKTQPDDGNGTLPPPEARYDIVFEALWNQETHPHPDGDGSFPGGAHWSPLVGALHQEELELWAPNVLASAGVEQVAETGATSLFNQEIDAAIAATQAKTRLNGPGLLSPAVVTMTDVLVDGSYPYLTLISMVAPSPDWFTGVSGLALQNAQNEWIDEISLNLYPFDAGTEDGTGYSTSNPETTPREPVYSLTGVSPFSSQPVARLTLIRRGAPRQLLLLPMIFQARQ